MRARYVFNLRSDQERRPLPSKLLLVQRETETLTHLLLKLFGYLLLYRDRLQMEPSLDDECLTYLPDMVHLDLQGRIDLWVECGECQVSKLDRLAVKAPYGEIWVFKRSTAAAEELARQMAREGLRRSRYTIVGFEEAMLAEIQALCGVRNDVVWYKSSIEPARMQFEFNGLWFESEFVVIKH
ncbi:MAG: YaeQ family protein [Verrucomicrobiales bacterium]|nr:YaeQ family protein [Verrucomicrobiales bacterium]